MSPHGSDITLAVEVPSTVPAHTSYTHTIVDPSHFRGIDLRPHKVSSCAGITLSVKVRSAAPLHISYIHTVANPLRIHCST
jgi:hypothetical protein